MEIIEVDARTYHSIIPDPYHVFGSAGFNELNAGKCENVFYLLFKDTKYRLGIIVGERGPALKSPFSAPFGGFSFLHEDIRIPCIDTAIDLLVAWARDRQFQTLNITLPPFIYHQSFISKLSNSLYRKNFTSDFLDLNYSLDLGKFDEEYMDRIWYNAKKNLKRSFLENLVFHQCTSDADKETAYNVIHKNRTAKGFPLRMTMEQVLETTGIVPADFFLVFENSGLPVASAIIFHVSKEIVQVVYWGDLPEFAQLKTMNYLSYSVFAFYKASGKKVVDIGPSTEQSIPNFGLCEFKEGIGCDISTKITYSYNL
jgi:hypothetical protein